MLIFLNDPIPQGKYSKQELLYRRSNNLHAKK